MADGVIYTKADEHEPMPAAPAEAAVPTTIAADSNEAFWDDSALIDTWDAALAEYKKYHSIAATGGDVNAIVQAADDEQPPAKKAKLGAEAEQANAKETDTDTPMAEADRNNPDEIELGEVVEDYDPATVDFEAWMHGKAPAAPGAHAAPADARPPGSADLAAAPAPREPDGPPAARAVAAEPPESAAAAAKPHPSSVVDAAGETAGPGTIPAMPQDFVIGGNNPALRNLMMSWYWSGYYTGLYEGQQAAAAEQQQKQKPTEP